MARTSVGILRGGASREYNLSLKTGASMLAALPDDQYDVRDIFIDKTGLWHSRGVAANPMRALAQVDVVLNALHGGAGEDGTVQRILTRAAIPYAGSRPLESGLALNKVRARKILEAAGVTTPRGVSFALPSGLSSAQMAQAVFSQFGPPYVIKPASEGAGNGVVIAVTLLELPDAIADVLDAFGTALVEEFVRGEEVSIAVIENFRGEDLYVPPPAHVIMPEGVTVLMPRAHEEGILRHAVPSPFSHDEKRALADLARAAHRALGLSHFSRADAILTPRGPYLLEVNSTPGLYPSASLPRMLESVGSSVREFLGHAISLAKGR